jgi:quercetin dioxygenase-like cupin family protein
MRNAFVVSATSLILALGCATLSAGAATPAPIIRLSQTWTVSDAPAGAWDVYVGGQRTDPTYWAGPHTHPGPEYGIVVIGQGARWNIGRGISTAGVGESFHTSGGVIHESGNVSDGQTIQFTTHILAAGGPYNVPENPGPPDAPKINPLTTLLYRIKFPMATHPATPFKMMMEVVDFPAKLVTQPHSLPGTALFVVVDGRVSVTTGGMTKTYGIGDSFMSEAGSMHAIAVLDNAPATAVVTMIGG